MRKPFYETDFDVKEYVNKRILEMESLSDRKLYKEMAENFMLPQRCVNLYSFGH